jgi:hypothetical protein
VTVLHDSNVLLVPRLALLVLVGMHLPLLRMFMVLGFLGALMVAVGNLLLSHNWGRVSASPAMLCL